MSRIGVRPDKVFLTCDLGGGVVSYSRILSKALAGKGWKVQVIASAKPGSPSASEVHDGIEWSIAPIGNLHYRLGRVMPPLSPLLGVIRGWEAARLYSKIAGAKSEGAPYLLDTFEGVNLTRSDRAKGAVCIELHSSAFAWKENLGESLSAQDKFDKRAERYQLKKADGIRSATHNMADYISKSLDVRLENLSVIPYLMNPLLLEKPLLSGTDGRNTNVICVGRPDLRKGAQYLMEALPLIHESNPNVEFHFVGWQEDSPILQSYPYVMELMKNKDRIKLWGIISYDELLNLYDRADISVVPSVWDNAPYTIYEAMARGCAIVASGVGGIPEMLQGEVKGWKVVAPADSAAIASSVIEFAADRDALNEAKRSSRENALIRYHPSGILERQMEFFRRAWSRFAV